MTSPQLNRLTGLITTKRLRFHISLKITAGILGPLGKRTRKEGREEGWLRSGTAMPLQLRLGDWRGLHFWY